MTYDSLFTAPTEQMAPPPPPVRRRAPVAAIVALVLALAGTALVAFPATRLIGLGAVLVLAVPLVLIWRRERGSRGFVLATSALAVLFVAFLVGFVLILVSGVPQRSLFGTSSTAPAAPAPPELSPGIAGPPPNTPAPIPDAVPPAVQLPPPDPAPALPPAGTAPAAPATPTAPTGSDSTDTQSDGPDRDRGHDSDREHSPNERRHATVPSPAPRVGQHCEVGSFGRGPDGSTLFCGQPDGRGDFTWRRTDGTGPGGYGYGYAPGGNSPGGYGGFFRGW